MEYYFKYQRVNFQPTQNTLKSVTPTQSKRKGLQDEKALPLLKENHNGKGQQYSTLQLNGHIHKWAKKHFNRKILINSLDRKEFKQELKKICFMTDQNTKSVQIYIHQMEFILLK